jgi:hypothetical protein
MVYQINIKFQQNIFEKYKTQFLSRSIVYLIIFLPQLITEDLLGTKQSAF